MSNIKYQKGTVATVAVAIITLLIVGAGAFYLASYKKPSEEKIIKQEEMMKKEAEMLTEIKDEAIKKENGEMTEKEIIMKNPVIEEKYPTQYSGTILAGSLSPIIDFNKSDYDKAVASDRLVVLYFYANWCPICREEVPHLYAALNELNTYKVIGFRVNYNDNQTDDDEKKIAKQFGVAYQHTKVFLKNGQRILKSPESWKKDRYLNEINETLGKLK